MADKPKRLSDKNSNSLSVREIISIFSHIDEQIMALHQCSSDDFLGLNADFKRYYKASKTISDNATKIFRSLSEGSNDKLFKDLQVLYKNLKNAQDRFALHIQSSISIIYAIQFDIDQLFLPVKNLNQDLMTLKFLLANLKLSNSDPNPNNISEKEKSLANFNRIINGYKQCSHDNEANIARLREEAIECLHFLEGIRNRNIIDLNTILDQIHYAFILFAEKHEEATRQIPDLTEKTESSAASIADIITNLQYQDIIRQKMEHIQATHKRILADLSQFGDILDKTDTDKSVKLLTQIRDIAGIQSAMLVKTNKEYQLAIEAITGKFLAIGHDMTSISALCQRLSTSQQNAEEIHLTGMMQKLSNAATILSGFEAAGHDYTSRIQKLGTSIADTMSNLEGFGVSNSELKMAAASTINLFMQVQAIDDHLRETLDQVKAVHSDIEKFENAIQAVFQKVVRNGEALTQSIGEHGMKQESGNVYAQSAESINQILSELNARSDQINNILRENLEISSNISEDVKESIKKIRYYDFFEAVIIDIILELNEIYRKFRGELSSDADATEDLSTLKTMYTMASEHQIHEKIVSGVDTDKLLTGESIDSIGKKDSDEVELF